MRRARAALFAAVALLPAGCGLGAGEAADGGAALLVTDGFGSERLGSHQSSELPAGETAMRQLRRRFDVDTRYGGGFVQAIEGRAGGTRDGTRRDWFFYVNGRESDEGAASVRLHRGDRVWWDRHDWGAVMRTPAVVGSFPAPFTTLYEGKRLPVRLDCGEGARAACRRAAERLAAAGITAPMSRVGSVSEELVRIVVGRWASVRADLAARELEGAPARSGVFARMDPGGGRLTLFDARGRAARTLGPGAGLIAAAHSEADQQPAWIVTGTDDAGLLAAAGALRRDVLAGRFAVALDGGRPLALPLAEAR